MVALSGDGLLFGHRSTTRAGGAAPGMMWCEFDEGLGGAAHTLRVAVLIWNDAQIRLAYLWPARPVRAFEAPGALGTDRPADIRRRSDARAGWEYAEAEGRAVGIRRLLGYDGQGASAPFLGDSNINLAYRYAEQPLVFETRPDAAPRAVAAASLARPAPFDPEREFEAIAVAEAGAGAFLVALPDGEQASPWSARLHGREVTGQGMRCVRVKPGAEAVCGLGIRQVEGVAALAAPGTLRLAREANGAARVTVNTGVAITPDWLGGEPARVDVLALSGEWIEVSDQCAGNSIPASVVSEWSQRNGRTLVEFRVSR
jgi:hypothetical protein